MTEMPRGADRARIFKGGRIALDNGGSIDCTVRNLSPTGAKISVENSLMVPDRFTLVINDGGSHACEVRWRKLKDVGLAFLTT